MKRFIKLSFVLLAMLGVLFTSCKKEYENPPIDPFPEVETVSIGDILSMSPNTTFDGVAVTGIVSADEQSGNLYKQIFIQDAATGKAIELMLSTSSAARIGDKVRVYLDSTIMFNMYHNLPQLVNSTDGKGFNPDKHLYIYPHSDTVAPIEPKVVTIADIKTGQYTAALVKLENVEFADPGKPFCDLGSTTNRTLKDATGEVIVRSSNYSNFAYDLIPGGTGSLVAIASVYNSDWQLILRSVHNKDDFDFEGGNVNPPAPAGELQSLPYNQSFATDFGTYMAYDVEGPQSWVIDYSTAKMTGYENKVNYVNEDWLISSPVALTGVTAAKVAVTYVGQYQNPDVNDVTLQVSTDYIYGDDPTTANWKQMSVTYPNTSGWQDFQTVETSLTEFVGQNVTVAIKFTSTDTHSRTMEVQRINITEGEAGGGGGGGGGQAGELQEMPYAQSFAAEFGTYTTYDVEGPQSWIIDRNTAKMTGFSGSSHTNQDWLLSSPVAVTGVSEAKVSVVYVAQYPTSIPNDVTLQVSTDYVYGENPGSATWTQMDAVFPNTSGWTDFQTVETSLNDFIGQNVTVAIKYISDDSQSRTIEIQSITVQEGAAGGGVTPPNPGEVEGEGTRENPYTANDVLILNMMESDGNHYWVRGYVVGVVQSFTFTFSDVVEERTNLIISSNQNTTSESECVTVQLPAGPVRDGLNLKDNAATVYKKEVLLYGTLEKYFTGHAGVKNVTYGEVDGTGYGTDPNGGGGGGGDEYLNETLTTQASFDTFSAVSVTGDQVWGFDARYGAVMSGFVSGTSYANEDWLITPVIDLSNSTNPVLVFDHTRGPAGSINVGVTEGYYTVWVTNDYTQGGNPNDDRWVELTGVNHATASWVWVSSGELAIPEAYKTATCRIAFRYESIDGASATWEIKNVVVKEQ